MKHGAQQGPSSGTDPPGEGICQAVLNHHGCKIIRPDHERAAVFQLQHAVTPDPLQPPAEHGKLRGLFRIDNRHMVEADRFPLRDFLNHFSSSQQDRYAELALVKKLRRLYHTRQLTIRENNPLGMFPDFFKNGFNKPHTRCDGFQTDE